MHLDVSKYGINIVKTAAVMVVFKCNLRNVKNLLNVCTTLRRVVHFCDENTESKSAEPNLGPTRCLKRNWYQSLILHQTKS